MTDDFERKMTSSDDEDDSPSFRAQLSKERSALANKVKRTSTRSESLLKNAKPLRSPVNGKSHAESSVADYSVVHVKLSDPPPFRNGLTKKSSKEDIRAVNGLTKKSSKEDLRSRATLVKRSSKEEYHSPHSLTKKSSRDELRYEDHLPVKKDSVVLPQPLSHGSSPQKSNARRFPLAPYGSPGLEMRKSPYGATQSHAPVEDEKLKSLAGYRVAQAFTSTSNDAAPAKLSTSPNKPTRKATVMHPAQPLGDSTIFSPPKPQRKATVITGGGVQAVAQVATEEQRRNASLKVAQFFGDPRLVDSTPKSLASSTGAEDAIAKAKADRQFALDREVAKHAKAQAVISAQPSADQMALPEAQRSRPTPLKAVALMGDAHLEKEMIQNLSSLPFDPSDPTNGKPARVLGSVQRLAQPKVAKLIGKSTDAEDAKVRAMARESDASATSTSTGSRMVANLRRRLSAGGSGGGSGSVSSSRSAPEPRGDQRGGTPQRRMLMRMYSSNMTDDPSSAVVSSNLDREIKQRQEMETRSELSSLLNRFTDVVISKS